MPDRAHEISRFLNTAGWQGARRDALANDASPRCYHRLSEGAKRAVLMDAPPAQINVAPFLRIARHLAALGFSVPDIFAADEQRGLVLLEDFGDETYNQILQTQPECEADLYAQAVDVLITLHKLPRQQSIPADTPPFTENMLMRGVDQFIDHFIPAALGERLPTSASNQFRALWATAMKPVFDQPETLVLRDFHIDNLIRLNDRKGIRRCGLLDFQDAAIGAGAYDLMSLLEDARRDIYPEIVNGMRDKYCRAMAMTDAQRGAFDATFAILGAQRHTRIIGLFIKLFVVDQKPVYLTHVPRVWKLLERSLCHPALADVNRWFDTHIPKESRGLPAQLAGKLI